MTERLIIRNFAGLNIDIELGRINIFIGPQASGKSVCVKLLYFFKDVIVNLLHAAEDGQTIVDLKKRLQNDFSAAFNLNTISEDFSIEYSIEKEHIQLKGNKGKVVVTLSQYYTTLFKRHKLEVPNEIELSYYVIDSLQKNFIAQAEADLHPFAGAWQLFIPASRAFFAVIENYSSSSVPNLLEDPYLSRFERFYRSLRRFALRKQLQVKASIQRVVQEVLRASLVGDEKEYFLQQDNGQRIKIQQSSSGQQEVLPLLLALEYLSSDNGPNQKSVVYIEEPEAHLHPTAQNALAQLMAAVYNVRTVPLQLFLTTHTPYLLTAFNNLIYAGQLADTLQNDAVGLAKLDTVVPKELRLHLADFRVYSLESGRATLMIDEETGLLRADSIDSVSDVTADQFGDLMALDPAIHS